MGGIATQRGDLTWRQGMRENFGYIHVGDLLWGLCDADKVYKSCSHRWRLIRRGGGDRVEVEVRKQSTRLPVDKSEV